MAGRWQIARLVAEALLLVVRVRLGLTLSSFDLLRRQLLPESRPLASRDRTVIRRTVRAICLAASITPFASCLTQALACQILLARQGVGSNLHLGVRSGNKGGISAHAWLTIDGAVVLGGDKRTLAGFSPIAFFGADRG